MAEKRKTQLPPLPQAELGKYRGLTAACQVQSVTQAQLQLAVETLRRRAAVSRPIDGPAARGDEAVLDFEGFDAAGVPIPDSRMENVSVYLGRGQMLAGVEDKICGHRAGETFWLDFCYPEDFRVAALSGQKARFQITLHTLARKTPPAADDAFAKTQGCDTMQELMQRLAEEKRTMHERMAQRAVRTALLEQAGENLTVEFPPALLDGLVKHKMQRLAAEVAARGASLPEYFRLSHQSEATVRAQMREEAEKGLRRRLAVEKIAQAEQLSVSESEIEAEYERLAKQEAAEPQAVRRTLTPDAVRGALLTEKVCGLLLEYAEITWTEKAKEE